MFLIFKWLWQVCLSVFLFRKTSTEMSWCHTLLLLDTVYACMHLQEGWSQPIPAWLHALPLDWQASWLTGLIYWLSGHNWLTAFTTMLVVQLILLLYHPVSLAIAGWLVDSLTLCTPACCSQLHSCALSSIRKGDGCMRPHTGRRCENKQVDEGSWMLVYYVKRNGHPPNGCTDIKLYTTNINLIVVLEERGSPGPVGVIL